MSLATLLLFALGLALLIVGADVLVRGAGRLAVAVGVSPLVVGLTVVAMGTSAPELAISVLAAVDGRPDLAVGNVVGSNIFNILGILGLSALAAPLVVQRRLVRFEVPLVIAVSALMLVLGLDGEFGRAEGAALVVGLLGYTAWTVSQSRRETARDAAAAAVEGAAPPAARPWWAALVDLGLVAAGVVLLGLGSKLLVDAASDFARGLGVSELVIGLTIVSVGSSVPEAVTSVLAALRGERDIAVGNVLGSNLFNTLGVLGVASLVAPDGVPAAPGLLSLDMPVMIAASIACVPIFVSGWRIDRWEGAVFVVYYVAYAAWLVLDATDHAALPVFGRVMLGFVVPLTALTLAVVGWRAFARRGNRAPDAAG